MKKDGEWYCDECGEKLILKWGLDIAYGQCICENCWTINDITEGYELQHDGIEKMKEEEDKNDEF